MKVSDPIANKVIACFKARAQSVVGVSDLLDLGPRAAVDQALSRLVRQGRIRRIRRGLYELPQMGKLLGLPQIQSPDKLVQAWAKNNGLRVIPSGAYAANLLGLSTQVPAKIVYYTNGRTQTLNLGPYLIKFLNRGPKTMDVRGQASPLVLQALRYLGKDGVTPDVIARLRSLLPQKAKLELKSNIRLAPAWMRPVMEEIIQG